jgi:hypothetical protein
MYVYVCMCVDLLVTIFHHFKLDYNLLMSRNQYVSCDIHSCYNQRCSLNIWRIE